MLAGWQWRAIDPPIYPHNILKLIDVPEILVFHPPHHPPPCRNRRAFHVTVWEKRSDLSPLAPIVHLGISEVPVLLYAKRETWEARMTFKAFLELRKIAYDAEGDFVRLALSDPNLPDAANWNEFRFYFLQRHKHEGVTDAGAHVWKQYKAAQRKEDKAMKA